MPQVAADDHPLVVQFAANDPQVLLQAVLHAQDRRTSDQVSRAVRGCAGALVGEELGADAVDLNLGCPQWRLSKDLELPSRGAVVQLALFLGFSFFWCSPSRGRRSWAAWLRLQMPGSCQLCRRKNARRPLAISSCRVRQLRGLAGCRLGELAFDRGSSSPTCHMSQRSPSLRRSRAEMNREIEMSRFFCSEPQIIFHAFSF